MGVSDSFKRLLARIEPSARELASEQRHSDSVQSRLEKYFEVKKFRTVGSYSRGTSVSGKSDIDLFCLVSRSEARWGNSFKSSTRVLEKFRLELINRFQRTHVVKDRVAVTVRFKDANVDVVPAVFLGMSNTSPRVPLYEMPDGFGDWMVTSPEAHAAFIAESDKRSAGKLRRVAMLMKYWCNCRSPRIPLSSFHIELLLAQTGICEGVKTYGQCLRELLQTIASRGCRGMHDPLGISGTIECVKNPGQLERALNSVRSSRDHASTAGYYEGVNEQEAKRQWNIVFNHHFPMR